MAKVILMRVTGEMISTLVGGAINTEIFSSMTENYAVFKEEFEARLTIPK